MFVLNACSQILGKSAQASADLGEVCSALASKSLLSQPPIVACAWVCKDGDFHSCSQSETKTMSILHFYLPVQLLTHERIGDLVSSASGLLVLGFH